MSEFPLFFSISAHVFLTCVVETPRFDIGVILPITKTTIPINFYMFDQGCLRKGQFKSWFWCVSVCSPTSIVISVDSFIRSKVGTSLMVACLSSSTFEMVDIFSIFDLLFNWFWCGRSSFRWFIVRFCYLCWLWNYRTYLRFCYLCWLGTCRTCLRFCLFTCCRIGSLISRWSFFMTCFCCSFCICFFKRSG